MAWHVSSDHRRTPGEQRAYIAGFHAGAGRAVEYTDQGKSLGRLLDLASLMEECVAQDSEADHAHPDRA
jgi:hypothetical protein